jgi:hypothetical protein
MRKWYGRASVNYGMPFQAGRGITQGGPLSAKLFNVLVDAVAREWLRELREGSALKPDKIDHLMATFFAIFYVNDAYLASCNPEFLQRALNVIVGHFSRIGLEINAQKTQTMICTPGRIRIQLPEDSYARLHGGMTSAGEWDSWIVVCCQCDALMTANSLCRHLAEQHDTYQAVVVPEDYLVPRAGVQYQAHPGCNGKIPCPVPGCNVTFRTSTLLIGLTSRQRATSPGASGAACRSTLHTRDTSGQRNAGSGWTGNSNGSRLSPWPLPCGASSMLTEQC